MRERIVSADLSFAEFNLENKIKSAGGFGRYQIMVTFVATILRNSGMCWHYCFTYLTMQQKYTCSFEGTPLQIPCTEDQICGARNDPKEAGLFTFEADTSYAYYLNNWIQNMDLTCVNRSLITSIASMTFFGFGLSGFLFFSIPDKYGRRHPLILFMVFHFCVQLVVLFTPILQVRLICFLLMGMCQIKNSLSILTNVEIVEAKDMSKVVAIINTFDALSISFVPAYFKWVSKNWFPIYAFMVILSAFALFLLVFFVQESPKWLLQQGRRADAQKSIDYIAAFNKVTQEEMFEHLNQIELALTQPANLSLQNLPTQKAGSEKNIFSEVEEPKPTLTRRQWSLFMLTAIGVFCGINLMTFSVTISEQDKYLNGMFFGVFEGLSGALAAKLLQNFPETQAHLILGCMGFFSTLVMQVMKQNLSEIANYALYAIACLGFGGMITTFIMIIQLRVPNEQVGCAMVRTITLGQGFCLVVPLITTVQQPFPFIAGIFFVVCSQVPLAFLPQSEKKQQQLTLVRVNSSMNLSGYSHNPDFMGGLHEQLPLRQNLSGQLAERETSITLTQVRRSKGDNQKRNTFS